MAETRTADAAPSLPAPKAGTVTATQLRLVERERQLAVVRRD